MKFSLLSFCLLISLSIFSQGWQLINNDYQYHFEKNGKHYNTILTDSTNIIGADTVYYLNRIVKCATCSNQDDEYILKNQTLFLGEKIICQSGNYSFFDEEVTFINSKATINDSWLYDTTNNITATISAVDFENILGNLDSTKTISLSNGDKIKISKNYGIVSFLNVYDLSGIQSNSLNIGFKLPDFYDFYNFDVGDVFEYQYSLICFGGTANCGEETFSKIEILSKQIFIDSIEYSVKATILKQQMYCVGGAGCWPDGDPISFTTIEKITFYNNDALTDAYNTQLIDQINQIEGPSEDLRTISLISVDSNGLVTKHAGSNIEQNIYNPFFSLNNASDSLIDYGPHGFSRVLKEGFGEIIFSVDYFELSESKILIGSIKNGLQTGTIHNEAFFLGISKLTEDNKLFTISPNPASNKTNITFNESQKNIQIRFYDVLGKEVLSAEGNNKKQVAIDIYKLNKGVYFIKAETEKSYAIKKLIKN